MAETISRACGVRPYELEVALDETALPASWLEHLFIALELEARQVRIVGLGLRYGGQFEPGIDYQHNLGAFETALRGHAAVAEFCGYYKLSFHGGSDKFGLYPIMARCCGERLHVKTAGTSYLEALRVVQRAAPTLFGEIIRFSLERFDEDRATHALTTTAVEVLALRHVPADDAERRFLDERAGRQLLHVTAPSVLAPTGLAPAGRPFREAILEVLAAHAGLYEDLLSQLFQRHLQGLSTE